MGGKGPQTPEGFERVFDLIGGHGFFQWRLCLIVSLQLIVLTWHHIGYAFLGSVPDHWCRIPELDNSNWTTSQIKMLSIPANPDPDDESKALYQKCEYYHLDYKGLLENSKSFEEAYATVNYANVTKRHCEKWDYDRSIYKSTVATDFDLVCENRWMAATIQGSYMAGGLVGTLTFGSLSDRFLGRRKTVLISLCLVASAGILAAFAKSYWIFVGLRFIISIGVSGSMQNCFVLITEHADNGGRAVFGMVEQVPFAIGYMTLPGLAYYFRDWWKLQLSFGLISLHLFVYYWILPESPRWLATHGHTKRSIKALYKIAKVNRMPKPKEEDLITILQTCHHEKEVQEQSQRQIEAEAERQEKSIFYFFCVVKKRVKAIARNFKNLMTTAEIRKRSLVFWTIFSIVAMVYYGIVFSGNLTSDPYLLVFLGGLMEVPAYTLIVPFVAKLGRRPTTVGNFILTGMCMLGLSQVPKDYEIIRIVLAMSAKLFVSSGFAIIYLLGAELYPTELRTTGLAVGIFMGRLGSISAPYIVDLLQNVYRDLPTFIFGTVAIIGGLVAILLPETKTMEMSDKLIEIEMHAEEEKAKEKERRQSWIDGV